jgi:Uma2 family endonuclease
MLQPDHHYTLEEFDQICDMYPDEIFEYVNGHIRLMSSPVVVHETIVGNVIIALGNALRAISSECRVVGSNTRYLIDEGNGVYNYKPDVSVICDPLDWYAQLILSPSVLWEVLSPSTKHIDRKEKFENYTACLSVREYLIVDPDRYHITQFSRVIPDDAGFPSFHDKWEEHVHTDPASVIALPCIDITVKLADVYYQIAF